MSKKPRYRSEHDIIVHAQHAGKLHASKGQPAVPQRVAAVLTGPSVLNPTGPWIHPALTDLIVAEYVYGYNRERAKQARRLGYEPRQ